ncbi:hypothetical protein RJ640_013284 [Escallonia rubra]|uniref:GST N-terminal domain-containing protein n=1 Tax=Escallonia rubra TaxID=112253 RepID=A0AA88UCI1_9ASTE|nr:hypothetical protein RJ640_013284 [Escallonia rubra]
MPQHQHQPDDSVSSSTPLPATNTSRTTNGQNTGAKLKATRYVIDGATALPPPKTTRYVVDGPPHSHRQPPYSLMGVCRSPYVAALYTSFFKLSSTTASATSLSGAIAVKKESPSIGLISDGISLTPHCKQDFALGKGDHWSGLQDKVKLVPIDLQNRPAWYKEKVYPPNKVPALEHNNAVKGESLDLIKYIDSNFDGPSLFPDDPAKREFAEELLSYTDSFNRGVITSFKADGISEAAAAFDYIETALSKFEDGPFFLGQFSLVDIAYAPFIERFHPFLLDVKKHDITIGRPKLAAWIEVQE